MTTHNVQTHFLDGRSYLVDEHRMIREPERFRDQPVYAPYFWNAYVDGTYEDERWDLDLHVIVFHITDDDRYDYPELTGATTVYLWEDSQGVVQTRLDRQG